jgi:hypothetical protein
MPDATDIHATNATCLSGGGRQMCASTRDQSAIHSPINGARSGRSESALAGKRILAFGFTYNSGCLGMAKPRSKERAQARVLPLTRPSKPSSPCQITNLNLSGPRGDIEIARVRRNQAAEHHRSGYLPCETRSFSGEGLKLPAEVFPYQQTWQDTVVDARQ